MPRQNQSEFSRALSFIETGDKTLVSEFLAHARTVAITRGIVARKAATKVNATRVRKSPVMTQAVEAPHGA